MGQVSEHSNTKPWVNRTYRGTRTDKRARRRRTSSAKNSKFSWVNFKGMLNYDLYIIHASSRYRYYIYIYIAGGLVQWLKRLAWKSEIAGSSPALAFRLQRNKIMFLSSSLVKVQYCGENSVTKRWRVWPQTARARISNPVSGRQCHLINRTIFRRSSLA